MYGLKDAGYESLLVGGAVRDLLLDMQPKDFDVATSASPEQVKEVFGRRCRLIGRRFRLAHVRFGAEIIEVSTFRAQAADSGFSAESEDEEDSDEQTERQSERQSENKDHEIADSGRILRDNIYGSRQEDAFRRDFTANALYYNIADFSIVDYVGGMADLKARQMRFIGDPDQRYREDPVRMLRAVRLATKLDFSIEASTETPIKSLVGLLDEVPAARLFEEVLKMFMSANSLQCFESLRGYGLFGQLFPQTEKIISENEGHLTFIRLALSATEKRIEQDLPVAPFFLFAALLWAPVRQRWQQYQHQDVPPAPAMTRAGGEVVQAQVGNVAIPKRFSTPMREIWQMQPRFEKRRGKAPQRLLNHPRFRAAYDFLLLRAELNPAEKELAEWWTEFQQNNAPERDQMDSDAPQGENRRRPRRRRRPRKDA